MIKNKDVFDYEKNRDINAITIIPEKKDKNFIKVYKLFSQKCLEDFGVLNGELKLLVFMMNKLQEMPLNSEGYIYLKPSEIQKYLSVGKNTYFTYLKKLRDQGYIEQQAPRSNNWRIKPEYMFKGKLCDKDYGKIKRNEYRKQNQNLSPVLKDQEDQEISNFPF